MNRLRTVAALAAAGLGVSACSGGTPALSRSVSPPAASSSPTPTASVPATTTVTSGSTTIVRIGPFTQEFGAPLPSDATQAQVITSFRDSRVLWMQSLFAGHAIPLMKEYVVGAALENFFKAVHGDNAAGIEPTGRDLLFDISVTGLSKNEAAVGTCDYDAHTTSAYRTTGKLVPGSTTPKSQDYRFETWHFVRASKHWALSSFTIATLPSPAARQCQISAG
jgi:hypothetical protein